MKRAWLHGAKLLLVGGWLVIFGVVVPFATAVAAEVNV